MTIFGREQKRTTRPDQEEQGDVVRGCADLKQPIMWCSYKVVKVIYFLM